jgi:hypothetical protein
LAFLASVFMPFGIFPVRFSYSLKFGIFIHPNKRIQNMLRLTVVLGLAAVIFMIFLIPQASTRNHFLILLVSLMSGTILGYIREWRKYKKLNNSN